MELPLLTAQGRFALPLPRLYCPSTNGRWKVARRFSLGTPALQTPFPTPGLRGCLDRGPLSATIARRLPGARTRLVLLRRQ